jgi:type I restriction enzyme M protein
MLTPELKQQIRKIWDKFYSGGLSNPLSAIEQISYLIFMRRLEVLDDQNKESASIRNENHDSVFRNNDDCRWSKWKHMSSDKMFKHVRDTVFPFIQNLSDNQNTFYSQFMQHASFMIPKASLLQEAVSILDELDITRKSQDTQGDVFEYLLRELTIAGKNGQFRTPRHIVKLITKLVNPELGESICDPACGTGGFLVNAYEHIVSSNTSEDLIKIDDEGNEYNLIGDKITEKKHWDILKNKTFYGFDFEHTMIRIGLMNMILHGISDPNISYADSLSNDFCQKTQYDVILANPPFSGSIDEGDIHKDFRVTTSKSELLFLELFHNILKIGGRAGIIVPSNVLFGDSSAHIEIRKILLEKCQLESIIYLPRGVFEPYAGIASAILIFTKGGHTEKVWIYELENDGYKFDSNHNTKIKKNDIPEIIEMFQSKKETKKSRLLDISEIIENDCDLFVRRYIDNHVPEKEIDVKKIMGMIKLDRDNRLEKEQQVDNDFTAMGLNK